MHIPDIYWLIINPEFALMFSWYCWGWKPANNNSQNPKLANFVPSSANKRYYMEMRKGKKLKASELLATPLPRVTLMFSAQ